MTVGVTGRSFLDAICILKAMHLRASGFESQMVAYFVKAFSFIFFVLSHPLRLRTKLNVT